MFNSLRQTVAGNSLYDVLHQLPAVGFDAAPLVFIVHAHIGDGRAAPAVFTDRGFDVVELATGRKRDGHAGRTTDAVTFPREGAAANTERAAILNDTDRRVIEAVPKVADFGVCVAPLVHDVFDFFVRQVGKQLAGVHLPHSRNAALIAEGQFCDLAALPEGVFGVALFDPFQRDAEHLRGGRLIDFAVRPEDFKPPLLVGKPRYDAGFDGAEVGVDQDVAGSSHKRGADKL